MYNHWIGGHKSNPKVRSGSAMISDTLKIALAVVSPFAFFTLLISTAYLIRKRTNKNSSATRNQVDEEATYEACSHCISCPGRSLAASSTSTISAQPSSCLEHTSTISLPHFEEKSINVRRLSAFPQLDEIRRVSSITSTLSEMTDQQVSEMVRRESTSTLIVTDLGQGHVGVERRPSVSQDVSSTQTFMGPHSPQDKRFSQHLPPVDSRAPSSLLNLRTDFSSPRQPDRDGTASVPPKAHPENTLKAPSSSEDAPPSRTDPALTDQPTPALYSSSARSRTSSSGLFGDWVGFPARKTATEYTVESEEEKGDFSGVVRDGINQQIQGRSGSGGISNIESLQQKRQHRITYLADVLREEKSRQGDLGDQEVLATPK